MPLYEYRCGHCGRRSSHLFLSFSQVTVPDCPYCHTSDKMRKLVSRVSVLKSEESRLEDLADPSMFADVDEDNPRSVARWARKLGDQLGEDLPPEYDEMVDQLERGEMPDLAENGEAGGADADIDV